MESSLRERLGRLGPIRDVPRARSGSPRAVMIRRDADGRRLRKVTATMTMAYHGASLQRAKRAVDAAVEQGWAVVELPTVEDDAALCRDLDAAGFHPTILPEAGTVDIAALRERLHLTREGFALAYGLDVESVRNWEVGRRDPGPVRAYLQAIANDPVGVMEAYAGVSAPR